MHVLKHWSVSVACFRESLGGGSSLICWTSGIARPRPGSGSWSWSWGQGWLVDQTPGEKAVWEEHAKVSSIFIPAPPAGVLGGGRDILKGCAHMYGICPAGILWITWPLVNQVCVGVVWSIVSECCCSPSQSRSQWRFSSARNDCSPPSVWTFCNQTCVDDSVHYHELEKDQVWIAFFKVMVTGRV